MKMSAGRVGGDDGTAFRTVAGQALAPPAVLLCRGGAGSLPSVQLALLICHPLLGLPPIHNHRLMHDGSRPDRSGDSGGRARRGATGPPAWLHSRRLHCWSTSSRPAARCVAQPGQRRNHTQPHPDSQETQAPQPSTIDEPHGTSHSEGSHSPHSQRSNVQRFGRHTPVYRHDHGNGRGRTMINKALARNDAGRESTAVC